MRDLHTFPVAAALLLATGSWGCGRSQGASPAARTAGISVAVRVTPVEARDVTYDIKALGSLEAQELVHVTAEVEGALAAVLFREGDHVTKQTVLARIDPERYRIEAQRTEAEYRKTVADQERADWELKRREELANEKLVAAEELNRARQEAARLRAEAASAQSAWDWAKENMRRSEVKPSAAGVINTRAVDPGQYVETGTVLATLVDTSRLRLRFKVSDSESLRAKEGETVSFRVASLGPRDFAATIYHVGDVADATTRQVEVLAWVKNPGDLKPGFFAEVRLATESHQGALVVPEAAIHASESGFVTYVVDAGKARLRPVEIGLRTGDGTVEILSGLKAGETVVTEGSDRVADGVSVRAVSGAAPAAATADP